MGKAVLWRASVGLVAWMLGACAPSEEEVKADFDEFIAAHNHCQAASECTSISPGCPLGCGDGVRIDAAAAAQALAEELIDDYESAGRSCDYDCVGFSGVACRDGRCSLCEDGSDSSSDCRPAPR